MSIKVAEKALRKILSDRVKAKDLKANTNQLIIVNANEEIPPNNGALVILLSNEHNN